MRAQARIFLRGTMAGGVMGKVALITGSDSKYFDLLWSLVRSIRHFDVAHKYDIVALDAGLDEQQKKMLRDVEVKVSEVGWGFPFITEENSAKLPQHLKCLVVRPFLPEVVPGYDYYMWLDADTWLQSDQAISAYISAAGSTDIAITPEVHYLYNHLYDLGNSARSSHYTIYEIVYGPDMARVLGVLPIFNAGVFAARANSPLWELWKNEMGEAMQRVNAINCDQVTLNRLVHNKQLLAAPLPPELNWICAARTPIWDNNHGVFMSPGLRPHRIEVMHITGAALSRVRDEVRCIQGGTVARSLLCPYPLRSDEGQPAA